MRVVNSITMTDESILSQFHVVTLYLEIWVGESTAIGGFTVVQDCFKDKITYQIFELLGNSLL